MKSKLAAVEQTLELHEIKVDVNDIAPVVPHANAAAYKYGEMTRRIYGALRTSDDWMQTAFVIELANTRIKPPREAGSA